MKLLNLKIDGIDRPLGYMCRQPVFSWVAQEAAGQVLSKAEITVTSGGQTLCTLKKGHAEISALGTVLPIELAPRTRYVVKLTVADETGDTAAAETWFETGKREEPWLGMWITTSHMPEESYHPVFRKQFAVSRSLIRARLYITALGVYEVSINGQSVTDEVLTPYLADYTREVQVQTYDVTDLLQQKNTVEVALGNGWYKSRYGINGCDAPWGDKFALLAELHLEYDDGTEEVVVSDPTWTYTGGDCTFDGVYDGEILDRTAWLDRTNPTYPAAVLSLGLTPIDRTSLPVRMQESLGVQQVLHTPAGETVLDFGQNHAGWLEFYADLPRGIRVDFDFGEVLQEENFYHANYRTAKARFTYVSGGQPETVRPHFALFGYRYVRVTGWMGDLRPAAFCSHPVYSALDMTGWLECGDERINRLFLNTVWSQRSNFVDLPTDCPQRDERLGWSGDAQVFAPTASYNMDTRAFFARYLRELRKEQQRYGCGGVPNYIPSKGDFSVSSAWGDAAAIIPSVLHRFYGSLFPVAEFYPLMTDWVDYVGRQCHEDLYDTGFHFGDWLAQDGVTPQSFKGGTDDTYLATMYYYNSVCLTADMADHLGYDEDRKKYEALARRIRSAILNTYFTAAGRLSVDTQTAYILALRFGVYVDKGVLLAQYRRRLEYDGYSLRCGFLGTSQLCMALSENGLTELAYDFLFHEGFPGWLYCIKLGATTIWERWNSLFPDGTCSGTEMNSFNHYSYGCVCEFLYAVAAGLRPGSDGFRQAVIAPQPDVRLGWLNCCYHSNAGTYRCNWRIEDDGEFVLHIEIPFDCTAQIILPRSGKPAFSLAAGNYDYRYFPELDFRCVYSAQSRLDQIAKNKEAMAVLKETVPQAAGLIEGGDTEFRCRRLCDLEQAVFLGIRHEQIQTADERLRTVLY